MISNPAELRAEALRAAILVVGKIQVHTGTGPVQPSDVVRVAEVFEEYMNGEGE
jgi:hypothetical protein